MSDIAIRVDNLDKLYHIGVLQQRHDTTSAGLSAGLRDALSARVRRHPKSKIPNPKSDAPTICDLAWNLVQSRRAHLNA